MQQAPSSPETLQTTELVPHLAAPANGDDSSSDDDNKDGKTPRMQHTPLSSYVLPLNDAIQSQSLEGHEELREEMLLNGTRLELLIKNVTRGAILSKEEILVRIVSSPMV